MQYHRRWGAEQVFVKHRYHQLGMNYDFNKTNCAVGKIKLNTETPEILKILAPIVVSPARTIHQDTHSRDSQTAESGRLSSCQIDPQE